MRTEIDHLMAERGIEALLVLGAAQHNPSMYYFTGRAHLEGAVLVKRAGQEPVLYCGAMEREEARRSGIKTVPLPKMPLRELLMQPRELLARHGITAGRIMIAGRLEARHPLGLARRLAEELPEISLAADDMETDLLARAMETKENDEVERIRKMGRVTIDVVRLVEDYLTTRIVKQDETLADEDGSPVTIGKVKAHISRWLAERGAEAPEGCIFSMGRDAGVPHSVGNPDDVVRLGRTIIFDIFPAEAGGGYYYDFTRTWALGYAEPAAQKLYDEVRSVYDRVVGELDLNASFKQYNQMVCDWFHDAGHDTPIHNDGVLQQGYVHSLGHGVGLNIHELPFSSPTVAGDNLLRPGTVITIEPGLYYPEREMGVRLEDTYWVTPDGTFERLAEYPSDFVLKMRKAQVKKHRTAKSKERKHK